MKRGQVLTELRRSHASGIHDHVPTRSELKREAIQMSMLDLDYPVEADYSSDDDWVDPTDEDLKNIEEENDYNDADDREVDVDDEDGYYDTSDQYDNEYDRY